VRRDQIAVRITEIDEAVGDVEAGLEASSLEAGGDGSHVGRADDRLVAAALGDELDVHALAGRVDGHVRPAAAVRADRLAGVGRTVEDSNVVERTAARRRHADNSPLNSLKSRSHNNNKLAQYGTDGRLLFTAKFKVT